jgi:putative membrane protein insertion efficiency factor
MNPMALLLRALIRAYQWIVAPVIGVNCRFAPSCSEYACEAIDRHGALGGAYLAARRLLRCHPWGGHGFDPVPDGSPLTSAARRCACLFHAPPAGKPR